MDKQINSGVQRVDAAFYELDSSMQAGNQFASSPYMLSQIKKARCSVMEFSTAFSNVIADGPELDTCGSHPDGAHVLEHDCGCPVKHKALIRFASDEKKGDQLVSAADRSASGTVDFFRGIMSYRLENLEDLQKTNVVINTNNDEMTAAAQAIEAATKRLAKLMKKLRDQYPTYERKIHDGFLESCDRRHERHRAANKSGHRFAERDRRPRPRRRHEQDSFLQMNNHWTEGLVSAAKAVARKTNMLIETTDGVISGRNSPEQPIVASNDVAASTAQLVAASSVKASFMSKTGLVRQVQKINESRDSGEEGVEYSSLSRHDIKVRQMEQQICGFVVEIMQLENSLSAARHRFSETPKMSYQDN
ncbi:sla2 Src-like adaptor 2 [Elasticomyces elasticus]|nr:sla2 Src-like adaptor 2 [Elasticomyces elasticus]